MAKEIQCAFGVDIDAVAGWLGSYGGEDSPSDIQRGVFAGEVGTPRLLELFEEYKIKASWFIPGHSIETFPEQTKMIAAAGHEIGAHGYSHENPVAMTRQQEEDVLKKSIELIEEYSGKKPRGYVAPWWEMSANTAELLLKNGFRYDHSQGYNDFVPFYARVGDSWTKIDYSKKASEWMRPMKHGKEVDLVEIGASGEEVRVAGDDESRRPTARQFFQGRSQGLHPRARQAVCAVSRDQAKDSSLATAFQFVEDWLRGIHSAARVANGKC